MMKEGSFSKFFYLILAVTLFSSIGVHAATTILVSPINPGHNSTQVFIQVGANNYITLQNARDYGYLVGTNSSVIPITPLPVSSPYELASQILLTYGSSTITLQSAINNNVFTGGPMPASAIISAGGDYASNVNVNTISGVMSLQNAISSSLLSPCPTGQHLDASQNCVSNCAGNMGQSCYPSGVNSACTNAGVVQCDGSCVGYSFLYFGTQSSCPITSSCDGGGHCVGYSGDGSSASCSQCPFGTTTSGDLTTCIHSWTTGGTWPTTYIYQSRVLAGGVWGGWFSNNNPLCLNTYSCNCAVSGSCDTCRDYYAWQIKPYSFIQAR